MRLTLVGPGRAGSALFAALTAAGHEIGDIVARRADAAADLAEQLGSGSPLGLGEQMSPADVVVIAVRDEAIAEVAALLAPVFPVPAAAVHLSGLTGLDALDPLAEAGAAIGSFHPLQTLPAADAGASALAGAAVAVTTRDDDLRRRLHDLAASIGADPFDLEATQKPLYHAAASAASNLPVAVLAMAADLFEAAGVPFEAARPLVEASISNVLDMGPRVALTGPVARGDVETVRAQLEAVSATAPEWLATYRQLVAALAALSGRSGEFEEVVGVDR